MCQLLTTPTEVYAIEGSMCSLGIFYFCTMSVGVRGVVRSRIGPLRAPGMAGTQQQAPSASPAIKLGHLLDL